MKTSRLTRALLSACLLVSTLTAIGVASGASAQAYVEDRTCYDTLGDYFDNETGVAYHADSGASMFGITATITAHENLNCDNDLAFSGSWIGLQTASGGVMKLGERTYGANCDRWWSQWKDTAGSPVVTNTYTGGCVLGNNPTPLSIIYNQASDRFDFWINSALVWTTNFGIAHWNGVARLRLGAETNYLTNNVPGIATNRTKFTGVAFQVNPQNYYTFNQVCHGPASASFTHTPNQNTTAWGQQSFCVGTTSNEFDFWSAVVQ